VAARLFPLVRKIADYLLSQRDANGLIYCKAGGVDISASRRGATSSRTTRSTAR